MMKGSLLILCCFLVFSLPIFGESSGTGSTQSSSTGGNVISSVSSSGGIGSGSGSGSGSGNGSSSGGGSGSGSGVASSSSGGLVSSNSSATGGTSTGTGPVDTAAYICSKYTAALYGADTGANELRFITAVVTRALLGNTSYALVYVQGILHPDGLLHQFFDGSVAYKPNPTNYSQSYQDHGFNTTYQFGVFALHLVEYFGEVFGCNQAGFPSYEGNTSLTAVHAGMHINWAQEQYFNLQLINSLLSFGVSTSDVQAISNYLQNFNRYPSLHDGTIFPQGSYGVGQRVGYPVITQEICSSSDCPIAPQGYSFCEKYTAASFGVVNATNEFTLITLVVTRAILGIQVGEQIVQGVVGTGSPLLPFFNGSIQFRATGSTPNFVQSFHEYGSNPSQDFGKLVLHVVQFLGPLLGCRDPNYPANQGSSDMRSVHLNMPITGSDMTYFIQQIGDSAASFGVDQTDIGLVADSLKVFDRGTNSNEICNQVGCPCQPGLTLDSTGECSATPSSSSTGANGNNGNGASFLTPSVSGLAVAIIAAGAALIF